MKANRLLYISLLIFLTIDVILFLWYSGFFHLKECDRNKKETNCYLNLVSRDNSKQSLFLTGIVKDYELKEGQIFVDLQVMHGAIPLTFRARLGPFTPGKNDFIYCVSHSTGYLNDYTCSPVESKTLTSSVDKPALIVVQNTYRARDIFTQNCNDESKKNLATLIKSNVGLFESYQVQHSSCPLIASQIFF